MTAVFDGISWNHMPTNRKGGFSALFSKGRRKACSTLLTLRFEQSRLPNRQPRSTSFVVAIASRPSRTHSERIKKSCGRQLEEWHTLGACIARTTYTKI